MTDQPKYTKGPWVARKGAGWIVVREHAKARREAAIVVGMTPRVSLVSDPAAPWWEEGESEANARLIAAAPDLLEALKLVVKDAEKAVNPCTRMFAYAECKAAIAKAEGKETP